MRIILWLSVFLLRGVIGLLTRIVIIALLGRGPAARHALIGAKLIRRITRL